MVLCCGRRSLTATDDDGFAKPPRRSSLQAIRQSLLAFEGPEDTEWKVGGRYKVQHTTTIYKTQDLLSESGTLRAKDTVLLLCAEMKAFTEIGLVVPGGDRRDEVKPGWIVLQNADSEKTSLLRRRLEGSWEMKGRYRVCNPATVRQEARLSSPEVGEVQPGQEVIVLELGLDNGHNTFSGEARLRAMICSADNSLVGWISPETGAGDRLLEPVNLLSMEVVKLHRQSLAVAGSSSPAGRASVRGSVRNGLAVESGGPRKSCTPGATVPWEVGGKYRVLEKLTVREKPELTSREVGKASAGALVTISDIHNAECAHLGWCPCAFISIDEGPEEGMKGWVRCVAKDGRDLIDVRDQLESEKILHRLRVSQMGATPQASPSQPQPTRQGTQRSEDNPNMVLPQTSWQNTSETKSDDSRQSSSSSRSAGKPAVQTGKAKHKHKDKGTGADEETSDEEADKEKVPNLLEQLESMETAKEDRLVAAGGSLEGPEKSICNCNCGGPGRRRH